MLVRDESSIIRRCLRSLKSVITSYYIIDTGSLDDTLQIIADELNDIEGKIEKRPLSSFSQMREQLYKQGSQRAEFVLFLNANETLQSTKSGLATNLPDLGVLDIHFDTHCYRQLRLIRQGLDIKCLGHVYETPVYSKEYQAQLVPQFSIRNFQNGYRSRQKGQIQNDIVHLLSELGDSQRDAEILLQLAKLASLIEQDEHSKRYLQKCIESAEDSETIWQAYYLLGKLTKQTENNAESAVQFFMQAYELFPDRAEPLYGIIECMQGSGSQETIDSLQTVAASIELPKNASYFEPACYAM